MNLTNEQLAKKLLNSAKRFSRIGGDKAYVAILNEAACRLTEPQTDERIKRIAAECLPYIKTPLAPDRNYYLEERVERLRSELQSIIDSATSVEPAQPPPVCLPDDPRELLVTTARDAGFSDAQWKAMFYESGPYDITFPCFTTKKFIALLLERLRAPAEQAQTAVADAKAATLRHPKFQSNAEVDGT